MQSQAKTVNDYLTKLPPERRTALQAVREVILENLPKGFEEIMLYGMIGYVVPHRLYPPGYHCDPTKPLLFAGLVSQKNYMTLHLMNVYGHKETELWFRRAYKASGKKLDMGKSCVRFKKLDDLALDVIGQAVAKTPVEKYVKFIEQYTKAGQ